MAVGLAFQALPAVVDIVHYVLEKRNNWDNLLFQFSRKRPLQDFWHTLVYSEQLFSEKVLITRDSR